MEWFLLACLETRLNFCLCTCCWTRPSPKGSLLCSVVLLWVWIWVNIWMRMTSCWGKVNGLIVWRFLVVVLLSVHLFDCCVAFGGMLDENCCAPMCFCTSVFLIRDANAVSSHFPWLVEVEGVRPSDPCWRVGRQWAGRGLMSRGVFTRHHTTCASEPWPTLLILTNNNCLMRRLNFFFRKTEVNTGNGTTWKSLRFFIKSWKNNPWSTLTSIPKVFVTLLLTLLKYFRHYCCRNHIFLWILLTWKNLKNSGCSYFIIHKYIIP